MANFIFSILLLLISYSAVYKINGVEGNIEIIIGGEAPSPYSPPDYGDCPDCSPPPEELPVCPEPIPPPPPPPPPPPKCSPPPPPKHPPPPPPSPPPPPPKHHPPPPPSPPDQPGNTLIESLLLNNQLSGCLPYEIGKLKKSTLFDASANRLTGPIPHSFGCMEKLRYLNVSYNHLSGEVPESLCRLRDLDELTLNHNYFTQVGPACRKLIKSGKLDIRVNCVLDLPSQRTPAECEAFFLKQQYCPNRESMNIVPCKIDYSDEPVAEPGLGRKLGAAPRTYAALQRPGVPG